MLLLLPDGTRSSWIATNIPGINGKDVALSVASEHGKMHMFMIHVLLMIHALLVPPVMGQRYKWSQSRGDCGGAQLYRPGSHYQRITGMSGVVSICVDAGRFDGGRANLWRIGSAKRPKLDRNAGYHYVLVSMLFDAYLCLSTRNAEVAPTDGCYMEGYRSAGTDGKLNRVGTGVLLWHVAEIDHGR